MEHSSISTHLTAGAALRQELEQLHGRLPEYHAWLESLPDTPRLWRLQRDHIARPEALIRRFREKTDAASQHMWGVLSPAVQRSIEDCEVSEPACERLIASLVIDLNRIITRGQCLFQPGNLAGINFSSETRRLLEGLSTSSPTPPHGSEGEGKTTRRLEVVNRLLLEETFPQLVVRVWDTMGAAIWLSHRQPRTALCISGGGIRSATFGLGVIQGLARLGVLGQFDYLSTVSGGGYIGSWLSSWIHHTRQQGGQAEDVFRGLANEEPASPIEPEPGPIRHLRQFSNYLTPKLGSFSADTWTLIGTYLRNLLLNWLVFVPLLIAALALPRVAVSLLRIDWSTHALTGWFIVGFLFSAWAIAYGATQRPALQKVLQKNSPYWARRRTQSGFLTWCFAPMLAASGCFSIFWAGYVAPECEMPPWWIFAVAGAALHLCGWILSRVIIREFGSTELAGVLVTGGVGGSFLWIAAREAFTNLKFAPDLEIYAVLAPPVFLAVFLVTASFFIGLTSRFTSDNDREWWARMGAWFLIGVVAWAAFASLSIFAPLLILALPAWIGMLGGLPGLFTLIVGFNQNTAATKDEKEDSGWTSRLLDYALNLAAPLFVVFLGALLSLGITIGLQWLPSLESLGHLDLIHETPLWVALGVVAIGFAFGTAMSWWINVNRFSLHSVYRNRLIRAYLGASNPRRNPNPFTGFDPRDNLRLYQLEGQRPMPVINMALNLVGGDNLAWQQRKAESFTATPLHAGSAFLGYRPVKDYAASQWFNRHAAREPVAAGTDNATKKKSARRQPFPTGLSLGTAVTISGAAASPNMGYHSSPIVALLLTLFNARLGAWLGNPGPAGEKTFDTPAPNSSVLYLVKEAFGLTNNKSPYVHLSDGGHFENLALYEMVRRRCRFIVVSDAGCDPKCRLEDLGNAIRKIRIDLGVPIVMERFNIQSRESDSIGKHCAIGQIRYDLVDGPGARAGILLYIKPSLSNDEPRDVFNYARTSPLFPHEPTGDQWFSESQFESYRMLGQHIVGELAYDWSAVRTREPNVNPLAAFLRQTHAYLDISLPAELRQILAELRPAGVDDPRAGLASVASETEGKSY